MPSTVVHLAFAGLVGAGLLGADFDRRSVGAVLLAGALPDLDTFAGLFLPGAHRTLLHTLVLPVAVAGVLAYDARVRPDSRLRARYGDRGVRVAWVALAAFAIGGVFPDLFTNGVNALYPVHDAFYAVNGRLELSARRGVVQTFVETAPDRERPTTDTVHYATGVDPSPGPEPESVKRRFLVLGSGLELLVVLLSASVLGARLWEREPRD